MEAEPPRPLPYTPKKKRKQPRFYRGSMRSCFAEGRGNFEGTVRP
jgi:hypothetical protein